MKHFLEQVAEQLYKNAGIGLNRHCLVFPNRRAGIFLMKHLAAIAGKPLWAPRTITINELFVECSGLIRASNEGLVFELYRTYRELTKSEETFDNFYFWGEMLLNDFDDIDKYLVDARALFTNISDLHAIDEKFGGLTPEQMEIISQFIRNFRAGSESDQKRDFEFTWSVLFPLYTSFKQRLKDKGIAFEGMIFREVVQETEAGIPYLLNSFDQYHFIGFNALNSCERSVLRFLKREGKAKFYWDYDAQNLFYREDQKSGFFIVPNIREFGQDLDTLRGHDTVPAEASAGIGESASQDSVNPATELPLINIIDIPSDAGQAKLLPRLLSEMKAGSNEEREHRSAVILADENLLPAVISSVPPSINDINITMGYPFSMTVVYSLLRAILDLQERPFSSGGEYLFDYRKVIPVLSNPLINSVSGSAAESMKTELIRRNLSLVPRSFFESDPFIASVFTITSDAASLCGYLRQLFLTVTEAAALNDPLTPEFLYRANQVLNRLEPLLGDASVKLTREIFIRLTDRIFREIKVPFRGEPLKGLQVMGLLESRALDFDNLIILSVNEGVLPKSLPGSSYIPYSLREAFGLPTINHHDAIYSYYFTRLLTRARRITFVYNSSSEGLRTGEMSRFLLRLRYSSTINPHFLSAYTRINERVRVPEERPRTAADIETLERLYLCEETSSSLSPSAINTWLTCTMKFYYAYICGLREPDRITSGIDPARFGTILHEVVARIYKPYKNQVVTDNIIRQLKRDTDSSMAIINDVLRLVWYGGTRAPVTGTGLITADIAGMFLRRVLDIDQKLAPFTIIELEEPFSNTLQISYRGSVCNIRLGGKIDRIDEREGVRRLIDYKTGKADLVVGSLEDLFNSDGDKLNSAVVQTMIYCVIMSGKEGYSRQRPVIYGLRSGSDDEFDDRIAIGNSALDDFKMAETEFKVLLTDSVSAIFDTSSPFAMTRVLKRCEYCPFKRLCQR